MAAYDFPASPSIGTVYTVGGKSYIWDGEKWLTVAGTLPPAKTARSHNLFINPAGQISQEWGNTGTGNLASSSVYYPFDMFVADWNIAGGSCSAIRSPTAPSGGYSILQGVVTPKVSLAAGDYFRVYTFIEGLNIALLRWPGGDPLVARFKVFTANPGRYAFAIRNSPATRSFVKAFTIPVASQWTEITIPVPAPVDGTWSTDNTTGLIVTWAWAAGSNYQAAAEGWGTDGTRYALASQDNGARAAGNFFIADFGLHPDPDNTGIAPPSFVIPDYQSELVKCWRYFQRFDSSTASFKQFAMGWWGLSTAGYFPIFLKSTMRTNPTAAFSTPTTYHPQATAIAMDVSGLDTIRVVLTAPGTVNVPINLQANNTTAAFIQLNARM